MSQNVSAVLQKQLPPKCKDPGMFTIPCKVGNVSVNQAMLDLGASINVMPYAIYSSLDVGPLKPTGVVIQLLDRSIVYPKGVLEDILVQVNELVFSADFYVIDMEEKNASKAVILDRDLTNGSFKKLAQEYKLDDDFEELVSWMEKGQAPELELKTLPHHLKYAYLGDKETLPVIISVTLSPKEERELVDVLKEHKRAIGWTIADIKGLSPSLCQHKILLKEEYKPFREAQRRLNPPMMEVVKKEILKLLDANMIYLISDSKWVSPVQVVPKKTGITVVENVEGELVPTHVQTGGEYVLIIAFIRYRWRERTKRRPRSPAPSVHSPTGGCLLVFAMHRRHSNDVWVNQGIVLGHVISERGIKVDKAKIDVIKSFPYPSSVREVRSFLGHVSTGVSLKTSRISLDPFVNFYKKSNHVVGEVLGQKDGKSSCVIYYASQSLDSAQCNYLTTEKELLAVVFALEKFRSYLLGTKVIVFSDHGALKYLLKKKDAKPRLIRWILLFQEFDLEIRDKSGAENFVADHLSRLVLDGEPSPLTDEFPDEHLFSVSGEIPWYADIVNYLVSKSFPGGEVVARTTSGSVQLQVLQ
ncbi:uncharacterized protein LOC112519199 [Cynara cardunculus var. scolymus]|uniref:uncharacterized protein LOC112519199 n=1 Tax=Cynara cardunculus var. scolymus TaxID=59895 RepID=UPI000D62E6F1|nr:uncharacterized protein LOC112519199 [Cynara cardunculus var. scolymus]